MEDFCIKISIAVKVARVIVTMDTPMIIQLKTLVCSGILDLK